MRNRISKKPDIIEFSCSNCGHEWMVKGKDAKMLTIPANGKNWVRFFTTCPVCSREVSKYEEV